MAGDEAAGGGGGGSSSKGVGTESSGVEVKPNAVEGKGQKLGHGVGKNFLAGAMAGATSTVLFQPFDVVKTHIQASPSSTNPGIRDVVKYIISRKGALGLWAGTTPAFVRVGIGAGLYFSMLGPIMSLLSTGSFTSASSSGGPSTEHLRKTLPNSVILGAGALTRSVAAFLVCPITVVKTRMEVELLFAFPILMFCRCYHIIW